jgi:hypothetical protein
MSKRSRLSRDQKRKQKLTTRKNVESESIEPYSGKKYQNPQFAQALFQAEVAIHEADQMSDEQMLDEEVLASLEQLVLDLRGQAPAQQEDGKPAENLISWNIKQRWRAFFQTHPRHSNADLTGIIRTIMHSVKRRSSMRPGGRGYLEFLLGFMAQAGVRVQKLTPEQAESMGSREIAEAVEVPSAGQNEPQP